MSEQKKTKKKKKEKKYNELLAITNLAREGFNINSTNGQLCQL